jgi:hypothetical protein
MGVWMLVGILLKLEAVVVNDSCGGSGGGGENEIKLVHPTRLSPGCTDLPCSS